MATISIPEPGTLMYSSSDPLQALQVNPKFKHLPFSNPNYSSMIQQLLYQFWKQKYPCKDKSPPEPPPALQSDESTIIHLVRPKTTQQIDLDSILKSKKSQKSQTKKKKSPNILSSSTINRSHSSFSLGYPSILEPPRNIFTPDWTTKTPETTPSSIEIDNKNFDSFDIISAHSRIEVFEYRIQMGEDENHLHPALARIAAESTEDDNFTKAEKDKSTRYEEQKVIQKVPLFWAPRVYDKEENLMSEQESNQLEQIIQKEIDSVGKPREKQRKKITKARSIPLPSLMPSATKKKSSFSNQKSYSLGRASCGL